MQRERGELVPIGDALSGMGGPVKSIREATPQALHHFTLSDADDGALLPPYTLIMYSSGETKLPFGNFPRLILAWVCTEAVRTQSRELVLGRSLAKFMKTLGVYTTSGETQTRLRNQMKRLFGCTVTLIYKDENVNATVNAVIADHTVFWWNERKPDQPSLWDSKIELSEKFFNEIINHPVPLDMNTLTALKRCSLGCRSLGSTSLSAGLSRSAPPRPPAGLIVSCFACALSCAQRASGSTQKMFPGAVLVWVLRISALCPPCAMGTPI